jgi:predicted nucleotide-binding protein
MLSHGNFTEPSFAGREKDMSIEFLDTDFDKANYLLNLLVSRATGKPADSGDYQVLRQVLLSNPNIADFVPRWVRSSHNLDAFWDFIKPKFNNYADRRTFLNEEFTPLLDVLEFGNASQKTIPPAQKNEDKPTIVARNKRNVFIVHGRDNETKQEVARFIENLGLKAMILHEQASVGMTIIEKIERYANDADFALVLYTPCDLGQGVHESKAPLRNRARQNVVFEHGYLMAKLGRENVCALVKGSIETPNDISGVVYVSVDAAGAWKAEVAKELKACGYNLRTW